MAVSRVAIVNEVARLKRSLRSTDETGLLQRPIIVSVIIPTFLRSEYELTGYRFEVIRNELLELRPLLERGIIDELIIVDGSVGMRGKIDDRLMRRITLVAYQSLPLFRDQVDLVRKYPLIMNLAKMGLWEFAIRIIHQHDPEIGRIGKKLQILPRELPGGKGAGMWLATGISAGDVIVYMDSDIRNFESWQVAAMIKPILTGWQRQEGCEHIKAYYTRLAVNIDSPEKGFYKLGGRVTRLFVIPLVRVLSRHGVLSGLEKLKYPLSGEMATTRDFIAGLEFPVNYSVELGLLLQIWERRLIEKMDQVDLHIYQHFPRDEEYVKKMVEEVIRLLLVELKPYLKFDESIVNEYINEAFREIRATQAQYGKAKVLSDLFLETRRRFFKDIKGDERRALTHAKILKEKISSASEAEEVKKLPAWRQILESQYGQSFASFIRRRSTISTLELLRKEGLVKTTMFP